MIHTANYYLFQKKISQDTPCRFDVVAILGEEIILIRNAQYPFPLSSIPALRTTVSCT